MTSTENSTPESILEGFSASTPEALVHRLDDDRLECLACGHRCRIAEGHRGVCRVRHVRDGVLRRPANYVSALACDPIEKKPFFHAFAGRDALTFGMLGCDLKCAYCQNWLSSQTLRDEEANAPPIPARPEQIVDAGLRAGARVVASSYNEPLITADWAVEIFRVATSRGMTCALVSNGNATPQVLEFLRPWVDLFKVDLKGFTDAAYRELGGRLSNILDTIRELKRLGFWVEIVTLIVPRFNDDDDELRRAAAFLAGVDPLMPWHLTAFHPDYKMLDRDRTTADTLLRAVQIGHDEGLRFVYAGNAPGRVGDAEITHCHECRSPLVRRRGFLVEENRMRDDRCPDCGVLVPGVWESNPPRMTPGTGRPKPVEL